MNAARQACQDDGAYLMALPAILATNDFDDSLIEALPWRDIEDLAGYCIDRNSRMPSGSVVNHGLGAEQRTHTESEVAAA